MCGIAGFLLKGSARSGPIGSTLLAMLAQLNSRGTDGTGIALYNPQPAGCIVLRVHLGEGDAEALGQAAIRTVQAIAPVRSAAIESDYLRLVVEYDGAIARLADAIERDAPGSEVFSAGREMEIVKQVGEAHVLSSQYGLDRFTGTHGIGHTRLATESRVDIAHSHPFWARPFPDICVVHNGQITNYHKLRRKFEQRGYHFVTGNDSEIIGLYIAHKMAGGATLEQALADSIDDLDGTFTYLVATSEGIGMAKDFFATKPLVVVETDEFVALASEEIALHKAFPGQALRTVEPVARELAVWRRSPVAVPA